ncbi:hypothetical protein SBRY_160049 [Actinacidiphila bryophytorum]|uniref:Uncharacterized protein n=1 Tax=Actinacidiphila bryophytorum TaxID=1436133 RepID=A0A9W4GZ77_9ACTN|nr:hypothetical protein SBRY_160049 [Actinacidiphila bryophytorum]
MINIRAPNPRDHEISQDPAPDPAHAVRRRHAHRDGLDVQRLRRDRLGVQERLRGQLPHRLHHDQQRLVRPLRPVDRHVLELGQLLHRLPQWHHLPPAEERGHRQVPHHRRQDQHERSVAERLRQRPQRRAAVERRLQRTVDLQRRERPAHLRQR